MSSCIADFFQVVIPMSGTPDYKQINLTNAHPENECACSPKLAMENGWICKPTLNLIDCSTKNWPSAVKAVFEREVKIYNEEKMFKPVILVNCTSIDSIDNLRNIDWFKDNTGKKFHFISIHSSKKIKDAKSYTSRDVTAEIDGKSVTSSEAYEAIEKIDDGELFKDDLPILVAQVQMIGEGINVSSFNAVITAASADKTAMQQIGRAVRNYKSTKTWKEEVKTIEKVEQKKPGFWNRVFKKTEIVDVEHVEVVEKSRDIYKVADGHANVYVLNDNLDSAVDLICSLDQYDLTAGCYSWGQRIDICDGSSEEHGDSKGFSKAIKNDWKDISDKDPDIMQIIGDAKKFILQRANKNWLMGEDNDGNGIPDSKELYDLVNTDAKKNFKEVYVGKGKKTEADVFNALMNTIAGALVNPWHKKIWKKSKMAFLMMVLNDAEIAKFFLEHLNKRQLRELEKI